ncbi:MAG: hypothetical protein ABIW76_21075 [Fibrobacteria bacterium]
MATIDLRSAWREGPKLSFTLDRIQNITGWDRLFVFKRLDRISMIESGTQEAAPAGNPIPVTELYLMENTLACLKTVLAITRSEVASIRHLETPTMDMAMLRHHRGLRELYIYTGLAIGFKHLVGCPMERFHADNVALDGEFLGALESWKASLHELWLENEKPFGPDQLPDLPALTKLKIPTYPETLAAWKVWRAAHPAVKIEFQGPPQSSSKQPFASIAEIHRDSAVMKVSKGKKVAYEVWGDFTGKSPLPGNNHDLRDWLEKQAESSRKKIKCFSEADELGISAAKPEDIKWCVDALLDGKAGPDAKPAPKGKKKP